MPQAQGYLVWATKLLATSLLAKSYVSMVGL